MKNKYNIKVDPPQLSSEQIKKHQNFDALFAQFEQQPKAEEQDNIRPLEKETAGITTWFVKVGVGSFIAVAASVILFFMLKEVAFYDATIPSAQMSEQLALKAPFAEFDQGYDDFVVRNALLGEILEHDSGSKIYVPPAAFVDEKGHPVQGEVNIQYREFQDHVDMFLAGVPKEINQHQNLQSVGMMEIKGFKEGKPVYLAQDKTLEVELRGTAMSGISTSDLDVFVYSMQEDKWQYSAQDQVEVLAQNTEENDAEFNPTTEAFLEKARLSLADVMPEEPLKVGVPDDMVLFNFDINTSEFPTLAQYDENIHFLAEEDKGGDEIYDYEWNSMNLEPKGKHQYLLTLTRVENNEEIKHKVVIWPAIKATALSQRRYEEQLGQYEAKMKQWNKDIVAAAEQMKSDYINQKASAWSKILNRFEIDRFGIWNCGREIQLEDMHGQIANFVDADGGDIPIKKLYISNKNEQLYYTIDNPSELNNLKLNIAEDCKIWAMTSANEMWVLNDSPSPDNDKQNFEMMPIGAFKSEEAIRQVLTF